MSIAISTKHGFTVLITIRDKKLLSMFGWETYPSYVTATAGLWWTWFKQAQVKHMIQAAYVYWAVVLRFV